MIGLSHVGDVFGIALWHVAGDAGVLLCPANGVYFAAGLGVVAGEAALAVEVCGQCGCGC